MKSTMINVNNPNRAAAASLIANNTKEKVIAEATYWRIDAKSIQGMLALAAEAKNNGGYIKISSEDKNIILALEAMED